MVNACVAVHQRYHYTIITVPMRTIMLEIISPFALVAQRGGGFISA